MAKLLELAKVTKDDVVFEPGCGDARMVAAAVKMGAKRGVGIDLDPDRIAEAKETVKKVGVADKVELRLGDALDIKDLDQATVVLLYMGNEFDLLIRPHLWRQLKVGARGGQPPVPDGRLEAGPDRQGDGGRRGRLRATPVDHHRRGEEAGRGEAGHGEEVESATGEHG